MKNRRIIFLLIFVFLTFSCATLKVRTPDGFALVRENRVYKAISPEGLLYKIRYVTNYPEKQLSFWGAALKNQLLKEGYQLLKEEKFQAARAAGVFFEWGAPYGNADYIYLTALVVSGKQLIIAEAAGEYKLYNQYKDSILQSLATIELKQ